jgi:hypothetical protein
MIMKHDVMTDLCFVLAPYVDWNYESDSLVHCVLAYENESHDRIICAPKRARSQVKPPGELIGGA